jgi:HSP20 family protein
VDAENLTAGYADGILHLTIPASPKAQARRVQLTRAAGGSRVAAGTTVEPGEAPAGSTPGGSD